MQSNEIRSRFLDFFAKRDHKIVKSDSLVPKKDPTLLFTGAGMNQFKEMFLATGNLKFSRAVSSQKCLRTLDIDRVGKTASHHTFFEMLGNFSFGDYFKEEAILWAWEFLTQDLNLGEEKLSVSVFEEDEEAAAVWGDKVGLPSEKISRLGPSENFWPANAKEDGPNGPCGPCTEIFYDRGPERSCGRDDCGVDCDCDRYVEVWNLVFTQYNRRDGGVLEPLQKCNIDTGMGLERITSVMQNTDSNFETDLFLPLIELAAAELKMRYDRHSEEGARLRRIADHARTAAFCIGDGVLPSNEGRGYVLRRVIRRALNDGRILGAKGDFFHKLIPLVSEMMGEVYPEVREMKDSIVQVTASEEKKFRSVVHQGTLLLDGEAERMLAEGRDTLSGEDAFKLYDTYGVPFDMMEDILEARGLKVDRAGFDKQMQHQRDRARTGVSKAVFAHEGLQAVLDEVGATEFLGYEKTRAKAVIKAIMAGDRTVKSARKGAEVTVILDKTPFYGEAGGQIGDKGTLKSKEFEIEVTDTGRYGDAIIHVGKVLRGEAAVGGEVRCTVDKETRRAVARSHTATHLLHHVLRTTLGRHVKQSGSLVEPDRLRFDLTHPNPVSHEEEIGIERDVNKLIMRDDAVRTRETTMEEALESGAIALFGEKYGDFVRVVSAGKYSTELCGGTHCKRTGEIGLFRIVKEEAIASGVRRIEAFTGQRALEQTVKDRNLIASAGDRLGVPRENLIDRMDSLSEEVKALRQDKAKFQQSTLKDRADELLGKKKGIGRGILVSGVIEQTDMDGLRKLTDFVRDSLKDDAARTAVAVGSSVGGKALFVCTMGQDLVEAGLSAGAVSKAVSPTIQGGGGGKPDMAQAGGKLGDKIEDAVKQAGEEIGKDLEGKFG